MTTKPQLAPVSPRTPTVRSSQLITIKEAEEWKTRQTKTNVKSFAAKAAGRAALAALRELGYEATFGANTIRISVDTAVQIARALSKTDPPPADTTGLGGTDIGR